MYALPDIKESPL